MSDESRVGVSTKAMPATLFGAAGDLPPSAGPGRAEPGTHAAKPQSSGVEEIADDEAQMGLAGTLISQASTGSDVRFEKVAALRKKIAAGTNGVAAEDVAEKLMDQMRKK
jgi:anti-sigma28 factor (negative regulator of flagellin synthesis)